MGDFNNDVNYIDRLQDVPKDQRQRWSQFQDWQNEPPCDMDTTLRLSLAEPYYRYGQDYGSYWTGTGVPLLFFSPCGGDAEEGCEEIDMSKCSDPTTLFFSWRTFWNCLMLSSLTLASRKTPEPFTDETLGEFKAINNALEPMGMTTGSLDDFNAMRVFNLTFECARASCEEWSMDGNCKVEYPTEAELELVDDGYDIADNTTWGPVMSHYLSSVCDDLPTLNIDIAGQGVLISYVVQALFVIALIIVLRLIFVETTINFFAAPCLGLWRLTKKGHKRSRGIKPSTRRFLTEKHPRLRRFLQRMQDNKVIHSVMTLLVDFQEAQCFFLMGVQIAVLVATSQTADFHGTFTIFSLRETRRANRQLGHMGILAVCLMQITLHRVNMDSAYTQFISSSATGVAMLARELGFGRNQMGATLSSINEFAQVSRCGQMGSMRIQCLGQTRFIGIDADEFEAGQQVVYLIVFAIILCSKVGQKLARGDVGRRISEQLPQWTTCQRTRVLALTIKRMILGGSELFLVLSMCTNLTFLFADVKPSGGTIMYEDRTVHRDSKPIWNIGQVLAILIWAPVLFKFLYILLQGVEEGVRMRLSNAYIVRRREELTEVQEDASSLMSRDSLEQDETNQEMDVLQLPLASTSSCNLKGRDSDDTPRLEHRAMSP